MGMEQQPTTKPAEQKIEEKDLRTAERLLDRADDGNSLSNELNSMSVNDQRAVFGAMKQLQADGRFGSVELVDFDRDGLLDNATTVIKDRDGERRVDVYDTKVQIEAKRTAGELLYAMSYGEKITERYDRLSPEQKREVFTAMKELIASDSRFSRITVIDRNGDGIMDDARAVTGQPGRERTADVYDTPEDARANQVKDNVKRKLPGALEGILRGDKGRIRREIEQGVGEILRRQRQ